ncbi:MAG: hypothetical protein JWL96_1320 [Sphingomonas bacterium]|uniref:DUF6265 family protein n=1 Tax=Sphingomonas bacterium TaxID=1895847 RepID=UPI002602D2BE|nr:DUF6265 family protein [Sphingomonas bacterium]MDB5709250.1 hypothetical protein [Sphingomonas bacterium]
MRTSITLSIALASLALGGASTAQSTAPDTAAPNWMAGCWSQDKAPKWTEECWMGARGGVMLGAGRAGTGDKLSDWEATQIIPGRDGKLVYWASPDGGARVSFTEVSRAPTEIVFANAGHDYPQRVRYWREGAMLNAEISLIDGSRAMRWQYKRDQ